MPKLGYTWYPKDFISDPDVMMMSSSERGIYRDLMDLAYMNDNKIKYSIEKLCKYCNCDEETLNQVLELKCVKKGEYWTIPSCQNRIDLANKNAKNGRKGGRPKKPKQNPEETQTETQIKPNTKGKYKYKYKENNKGGVINRKNIELIDKELKFLLENHSYDASEEISYLTSLNNRIKKKREDTGRPTSDDDIFNAFCFFIDHKPEWFNFFSIKALDNNFESLQKSIKDKIEEESKEFHPIIERI